MVRKTYVQEHKKHKEKMKKVFARLKQLSKTKNNEIYCVIIREKEKDEI